MEIVDVQTINCDQTDVCNIKVPAPGAALVFLSDQAPAELDPGPMMGFPTTAWTKLYNAATVGTSRLAILNGNKSIADSLAGSSQGRGIASAFGLAHALSSFEALVAGAFSVTLTNMR